MVHLISKYALRPTGLLLMLLFAVSLVWCGDSACRPGASDDHCTSLICALLASHNSAGASQANGGSTECMCLCHAPILSGNVFDEHTLAAESTTFEFTAPPTSFPTRSIDHPPKL